MSLEKPAAGMHQRRRRGGLSVRVMPQQQSFWCQTLGRLALYADPDASSLLMDAGKPLAALVYLAFAPKNKVDRDHLAELLWPGTDLAVARHSLRQALYRLREATHGALSIRVNKTALELISRIRLDCLEAERTIVDGDGARAYELLRGNFLEGFSIPESREFESWAEAQRIRFRECRAGVADLIARRHLNAGEPERALEVGEELATLKPFSDAPIRIVMEALARMGRHATALARFHAYAELLKREVEDEPGLDLVRYATEVEHYLQTRPEPSVAAMPFVGRSGEWSKLETAWGSSVKARGGAVLIEGAAGFGKSRLLEELANRVRAMGGVLLSAKCYEIERAVPYGVVAGALGGVVGRPEVEGLGKTWLAEVARLLPELRERWPNLPDLSTAVGAETAKHRMHEAVARCLEGVSRSAPVLVAADDIQWADAPSLELLHYLIHRLGSARLLVVASYRPAELSPVARQFARSVCAERLAELISLVPLEREDVAELLSRLGRFDDSTVKTTVAAHLQRHSGGNPLFLSELLGALERSRQLAVRDGTWRLAPGTRIQDLPHTLGKLMADRIDALAPWMRACVETLAVAATETTPEVLAQALDMSEPRVELACSVLEEERLVRRTGTGFVELVHDELRRLVYQGVADERRRLLHGALGMALEGQGEAKRPGGAARLAQHFDQSGDQARAHRYALQAAGEAGALSAVDAQRVHLELAAAHSPQALPPASSEGAESAAGRRSWLRRPAAFWALGTILAVAGVAGGLFLGPWLAAFTATLDLRHGTLYLAPSNVIGATREVRWGLSAGPAHLVSLRHQPATWPAQLAMFIVREGRERHEKVFLVRGNDTTQLTRGPSDDVPFGWSPDGRFVILQRGWKADSARYQQNIFLIDSSGRVVRTLTRSLYEDEGPAFSPTGTRFAFTRDSLSTRTVWLCDADGTHCDDLTSRFGLPNAIARLSFSPHGGRLAAVFADSLRLAILDLSGDASTVIDLAVQSLVDIPPVWSPDGHWVAFVVRAGNRMELRAQRASGAGSPRLVAILPGDLRPTVWEGGKPASVHQVMIDPRAVRLPMGRGIHVTARMTTAQGAPVESPVRWRVADTSIALADSTGFVRGRAPGTTWLVASAGGFLADSVTATVSWAGVDTLLFEDWSGGLDTSRWTPFGTPRPVVTGDPEGKHVFWNHGDYNQTSGVVSTAHLEVGSDGLTVEAETWAAFTGAHWQFWTFGALPDRPAIIDATRMGDLRFRVVGENPTQAEPHWFCLGEDAGGVWPTTFINRRWHRFAIEFRPDGWAECYVDGELLRLVEVQEAELKMPLSVLLDGQSEGTRIYHGRVVVTRGLRY